MSELKPCPFCGDANIQHSNDPQRLTCANCGAKGPYCDLESPAEAWNERIAPYTRTDALMDEEHIFALAAKHDGFGDRKHFDFTGAELLEFAVALLSSRPTGQGSAGDSHD